MSASATLWALKTEALLIPTPLAGVDPAGEEARVAALRARLGLPADEASSPLLEDAQRDAYGAQEGSLKASEDAPRGGLEHPLGAGERSAAPVDQAQLAEAWESLVNGLEEEAPGDAKAWSCLWKKYNDIEIFKLEPNRFSLPDHSVSAHRSLTAALVGARAGGDQAALLLVQVGPVQPYIEASRKTADLWAGSYLMSFLAFKALEVIARELGPDALLSPRPDALPLARRMLFDEESVPLTDLSQPALPAKVLALVPGAQAAALGRRCLTAIERAWRELGAKVKGWVDGVWKQPWDALFDAHMDAFLERGFTVQPWPDDRGAVMDYLAAVNRAPQLVDEAGPGATYGAMSGLTWDLQRAARRAQAPSPHQGDGRFKCTLCGQREQVGPGERWASRDFWKALRRAGPTELKSEEALCAVCLCKRLAPRLYLTKQFDIETNEDPAYLHRFPSIPSVASAPFRERMKKALDAQDEAADSVDAWVRQLGALCDLLPKDLKPPGNGLPGLGMKFGEIGRYGKKGDWHLLDMEGAWMDEDAYEPERAWYEQVDRSREVPEYGTFCTQLERARDAWLRVQRDLGGKPSHYVAALYLDGDKLSAWLNGRHKGTPTYGARWRGSEPLSPQLQDLKRPVFPALQGEVSARLSTLAAGAVAKVVHQHLGRLVYCGGDDVVALLPLATALHCAAALERLIRLPEHLGQAVTVTAGLAVQHQREPLSRLIHAARKAEKTAKDGGRNRWRIHLVPRSGDELTVELPWQASGIETIPALDELVGKLDEDGEDSALNLKLGYQLREERFRMGNNPELIRARILALSGLDRSTPEKEKKAEYLLRLPLWMATYRPETDRERHPVVDLLLLARFLRREGGMQRGGAR